MTYISPGHKSQNSQTFQLPAFLANCSEDFGNYKLWLTTSNSQWQRKWRPNSLARPGQLSFSSTMQSVSLASAPGGMRNASGNWQNCRKSILRHASSSNRRWWRSQSCTPLSHAACARAEVAVPAVLRVLTKSADFRALLFFELGAPVRVHHHRDPSHIDHWAALGAPRKHCSGRAACKAIHSELSIPNWQVRTQLHGSCRVQILRSQLIFHQPEDMRWPTGRGQIHCPKRSPTSFSHCPSPRSYSSRAR